MSLLYTIEGLKEQSDKYRIIVALAKWNRKVADFYESHQIEVVQPKWIDTYEHTTALHYSSLNPIHWIKIVKQHFLIRRAKKATKELINEVQPDIVHLNSSVLVGSAIASVENKIPLIWHIREHPVKGTFYIRTKWMQAKIKKLATTPIFICNADRVAWGNPNNGQVIYNFVNFDFFDKDASYSRTIEDVNIPKHTFNVAFLGGVNRIKGAVILLQAIVKLKVNNPSKNIKLLFAGGEYNRPSSLFYKIVSTLLSWLGRPTYSQHCEDLIQKYALHENIIRLPFTKEVPAILSHSDVLVFPSIRPHFARPVIEAGAMAVPVIGSDLSGVRELIDTGTTGWLFEVGSHEALYEKLQLILDYPEKAREVASKASIEAERKYNQRSNIRQLLDKYDCINMNY